MKKILSILVVILLCGCQKTNDLTSLKIVVPSGAPSLAFYSQIDNENFNTADAKSIIPELKSDSGSEIIVIDTINGIKALNDGANYYLAGTITFGNFYIAATGNDDNNTMDDGDYIVLFSQNATPDLIFHYLYGNKLDSNIHYVNAVSEASACLIKGKNITDENHSVDDEPYVDYVMIAEPALTTALSKNDNAYVYQNIQELYKEKTNGLSLIQASVFVSKKLSNKQIDDYLSSLQKDINDLLANPNLFAEAVSSLADEEIKDIFGIANAKIVNKVLSNNSIGIGYIKAYDNKQAIDSYINIFGMENTNEEIYFK